MFFPKDKPVIHVNTSQFSALEHRDSLSMVQFRADGNPEPSVEWYLEGRQVNATKLLTRGDSGEYVLSATNDLGNTNSTVYITVECEWMRTITFYLLQNVDIHSRPQYCFLSIVKDNFILNFFNPCAP